jgi:hypothetical protein
LPKNLPHGLTVKGAIEVLDWAVVPSPAEPRDSMWSIIEKRAVSIGAMSRVARARV